MLPGEDSISVCLENWVDLQEAEMGEGLLPSKWTAAFVKIWKAENTLEEWQWGACRARDK